jgi:hypothetical protein
LNTEKLSSFSGVVQVAQDLVFEGNPLMLNQRGLIIDLNNHRITLETNSFVSISSNNELDPDLNQLPYVTIRNGSFYQDVTNDTYGNKFVVYHGTLNLENIDVTLNCENVEDLIIDPVDTSKNTYRNSFIVRMNGANVSSYVVSSEVNVDRYCNFSILNVQNEQYCFS